MKRIGFQLFILALVLVGCEKVDIGKVYVDFYSESSKQKDIQDTATSTDLIDAKNVMENKDTILSVSEPDYFYESPFYFEYPDKNFYWADTLVGLENQNPYSLLKNWENNIPFFDSLKEYSPDIINRNPLFGK